MKQQRTLKYIISSLFVLFVYTMNGQEEQIKDTTAYKQSYGFRVGLDISRPIIQSIQKEDLGLEITGDYRISNSLYLATELGYESEPTKEDYVQFHTKGSYIKLGANYNAYENWQGMSNEVYFGLRYGYSAFSQKLMQITAVDLDNYFGAYEATPDKTYDNLQAHWMELHFGLKVEVFRNLYLTTAIQFKKLLSQKKPENFANLYIPGYQSISLNNGGVGFNYTIAYLIPFKKK